MNFSRECTSIEFASMGKTGVRSVGHALRIALLVFLGVNGSDRDLRNAQLVSLQMVSATLSESRNYEKRSKEKG